MLLIAKLFPFGGSSDHHCRRENYRKLFPHRAVSKVNAINANQDSTSFRSCMPTGRDDVRSPGGYCCKSRLILITGLCCEFLDGLLFGSSFVGVAV